MSTAGEFHTGQTHVRRVLLELPDPDEQRLVVYLASDEATNAALDRLTDHLPTPSSALTGNPPPAEWAGVAPPSVPIGPAAR